MELAGAEIPAYMNGKSFAKQIVKTGEPSNWREMYMIE